MSNQNISHSIPALSNPSSALLWYLFKQNQWGLIAVFSSIPVILFLDVISNLLFDSSMLGWFSKIHLLLLIMILPLLAIIVTYGELNAKTAKTGLPKFTFVHPVSSLHLALVPILFGIVLSFIFMVFWLLLIAQKDYNLFQYLITLITCCIGVVWLQFMAWRLSNAPYLTVTIFITLVGLLFVCIVSLWDTESTPPLINPTIAIAGLLSLLISGTWFAINAVKKSRTNQHFGKKWKLSQIQFIGFILPKMFSSKQQALFRFEWRVFGWMLPMAGLFMTSLLIFAIFNLESDLRILDTISLMAFGTFYLPLFAPTEMSRNYLGSKSSKILSFTAQLPISNRDIANAKLTLALKSILLFLLIVLVPINLFLFSLESASHEIQPWSWLQNNMGLLSAILVWASLNLLIPTLTWMIGGNILSWHLKGKSLYNKTMATNSFIFVSIVAFISYRLYLSDEFKEFILGYLPALNIIIFLLIGLIFSKAVKSFQHHYHAHSNQEKINSKKIYTIPLLLLGFFLSTFWTSALPTEIKFQLSFVLFDVTMLSILPFLTAPFSVRENRSS